MILKALACWLLLALALWCIYLKHMSVPSLRQIVSMRATYKVKTYFA